MAKSKIIKKILRDHRSSEVEDHLSESTISIIRETRNRMILSREAVISNVLENIRALAHAVYGLVVGGCLVYLLSDLSEPLSEREEPQQETEERIESVEDIANNASKIVYAARNYSYEIIYEISLADFLADGVAYNSMTMILNITVPDTYNINLYPNIDANQETDNAINSNIPPLEERIQYPEIEMIDEKKR